MESLRVLVFYANILIQKLYSLNCNMANWVTPNEHGDFSSVPGLLFGTVLLKVNLSKVSSMVMCMLSLTACKVWALPSYLTSCFNFSVQFVQRTINNNIISLLLGIMHTLFPP